MPQSFDKKFSAVGVTKKDGKEGLGEFDIVFINGKPYAIIGPAFGGAAVELKPLDPSRLFSKDAGPDFFYVRTIDLDHHN